MVSTQTQGYRPPTRLQRYWKRMVRHRYIYLLLLPVVIYYLVFHYGTIYYAVIAFQNFKPKRGISGSSWVGMKNFVEFLTGNYAWRVIRNTLVMNLYCLAFGFTSPIILALMINQISAKRFRKGFQTILYLPHFISTVVMVGLLLIWLSPSRGLIGALYKLFGREAPNLMASASAFPSLYVWSDVWQHAGWDSIVFLAALSSASLPNQTSPVATSSMFSAGR